MILKKIYLYAIPCCLMITEIHACGIPKGHVFFHNNTWSTLHLNIQRVSDSYRPCFLKAKNSWSEKQEKTCSKIQYKNEMITLAPKRSTKGLCWSEHAGKIIRFDVTYEHLGKKHAGPRGDIRGYKENFLDGNIQGTVNHKGDQTLIKSSGASTHTYSIYTAQNVNFDMSTKG